MPNSSSYWCPWCLLSRVGWQQSADNTGQKRTAQFLNDTYSAIQQDTAKRMQPNERKGVSCAMHYKSLTPDNFVPPLLHMEMGMVNQVWEDFENWIDDKVELIPIEEKLVRTTLDESRERLRIASSEKDDAKKNISIELKQTNAEIKALKRQVKIRGIAADAQQELQARVTLLTA